MKYTDLINCEISFPANPEFVDALMEFSETHPGDWEIVKDGQVVDSETGYLEEAKAAFEKYKENTRTNQDGHSRSCVR